MCVRRVPIHLGISINDRRIESADITRWRNAVKKVRYMGKCHTDNNPFVPKVHATQTNTDNTIDEVEIEDTTSHLPQYHDIATCDTDPNDQQTFDSEPPSLGRCPTSQSTVLTEPEFITEIQSNKLLEESPSVTASVIPNDWDSVPECIWPIASEQSWTELNNHYGLLPRIPPSLVTHATITANTEAATTKVKRR